MKKESLKANPFEQFSLWLNEAVAKLNIRDAHAMAIATVDVNAQPSQRIVLLNGLDNGFIFFTNYDSRKAQEIQQNNKVALLFWWPALDKQVRIEGTIAKVSDEVSERYFQTRPRGSQISAHASPQSAVISNRDFLEEQVEKYTQNFGENIIPRPQNWGGFRVTPTTFEFWIDQPNRLHDRFRYRSQNHVWIIEQLAP